MSVAIITGSAGLVGSEGVRYFSAQGMDIVGIDNDMRAKFFGQEASTRWVRDRLFADIPRYHHYEADVRDARTIEPIFAQYGKDVALIIHTAAQPSHDWAASDPTTDFTVNANGTSVVLEATRKFAHEAVFIFTSTNKVYGDRPNHLPLVEYETRWEPEPTHPYAERGIPETMSIDGSLHSLFGVSKMAADALVQEYGRYFGMKTACFRGGCLTGPGHSGTQLHGFLAYLMKCAVTETPYTIFGYKKKQVRDNIHSADLIRAFDQFFKQPRSAEVYNMGEAVTATVRCSKQYHFAKKSPASHFNRNTWMKIVTATTCGGSVMFHGSSNTIHSGNFNSMCLKFFARSMNRMLNGGGTNA